MVCTFRGTVYYVTENTYCLTLYGGYACDIIKPGSYAEMPTVAKKNFFGRDSPYIQTEKPILIILKYIQ